MTQNTCTYRSTWTDSGDRGADMHDHRQRFHPDHEHVWGPSTYSWEQPGTFFVQMGSRYVRTETDVPVRCTVCQIKKSRDMQGKPCM